MRSCSRTASITFSREGDLSSYVERQIGIVGNRPIVYSPIQRAADILRKGGMVAFPTETVYGLGARAFDKEAVARIFAIKGRPDDNPLIVHIAQKDQLHLLSPNIPSLADRLIEAFWPGPLTLVLERANDLPAIVSAGLSTVAVRMPNHKVALSLIRAVGEPIAAPSANRSGHISPTSAHHVRKEFGNDLAMILDGGPCTIGLESTVLDLTADPPRILRPGTITQEAIASVIGTVASYSKMKKASGSPGLKQSHYAPQLTMILVPSNQWQAVLSQSLLSGQRIGTLSMQKEISPLYSKVMTHLADYAHNLFASLHEAEEAGVDILLVEAVPHEGLGIAIMDRLERGAGFSRSGVD